MTGGDHEARHRVGIGGPADGRRAHSLGTAGERRLPVRGGVLSKCDGPVQPDGTWQRCVAVTRLIPNGASSYLVPDGHCDVMGPDQRPSDLAFADPPSHID